MYRNFPYHFVRGTFEKLTPLFCTLARQVEKLAHRLARKDGKLARSWHVSTQARRHINHAGMQGCWHVNHASTMARRPR